MMPRTAGQKLRAQVALSCAPRLNSGALPAPCERSTQWGWEGRVGNWAVQDKL